MIIEKNISNSRNILNEYLPIEQVNNVFEELKAKLNDQVLQVMLYGAYNAGKSTLINALLGQEKALINDKPTTDTIDSYNWYGYRLLDTPGVNAPIEHEQITQEQVKRTQVVLFVIRNGDQDSKDIYKRLFEMITLNKKVFIVLNHELTNVNDKIITYQKIIKIICQTAATYGVSDEDVKKITIIPMNVKTALKGRLQNNHPKLLEHSGYTDFINKFSDWLKINDSKNNHLDEIKSFAQELWYKPIVKEISDKENKNQDENLNLLQENKKTLVDSQYSLIIESRNLINHELISIKSDISGCMQSSNLQAELDSKLQCIIDPLGKKLEDWLIKRFGEVKSTLTVPVSHSVMKQIESNQNVLLDSAVKELSTFITPDNIKNMLLKGRAFKLPGLKGRWEKTLTKWSGKATVVLQVAGVAWDFYKAGNEENEQNNNERQYAVSLNQAVEEICSKVRQDYTQAVEKSITEVFLVQISALDIQIQEIIKNGNKLQKNKQYILNLQSELQQINYQ